MVAFPRGRPAVFLDRDGVLVLPEMREGRGFAPRDLRNFHIYDEAADALTSLKRGGYALIVVTNQPDIGNGLIDFETINQMHRRLSDALPIEAIEVCPHRQTDDCNCRKPKPGMLMRAAARLRLDLTASFIVGDRASDIAAGRAVGCRTVYIDLDYEQEEKPAADWVVGSISEAASAILNGPVGQG